jgi:hypothetical protein
VAGESKARERGQRREREFGQRFELVLEALVSTCGARMRCVCFLTSASQTQVVGALSDIASSIRQVNAADRKVLYSFSRSLSLSVFLFLALFLYLSLLSVFVSRSPLIFRDNPTRVAAVAEVLPF